jgi:hypothetical protein
VSRGMPVISGLLAASDLKDPSSVRDQLDRAVTVLGLGGCVDDVILPVMHQIGIRWQLGLLDIDTERLMTETVRGWLERVALRAPRPDVIAPSVLACGPGERHSIGLEALGVLLRYERHPCRMLGPRTSLRALTAALKVNRPSGVVIVSHRPTTRRGAIQLLHAAAGPNVGLFYAGDAFATAAMRCDIPGTYLGTNIQAACAAIVDSSRAPDRQGAGFR